MPVCLKCRNSINGDSKFCPECGTSLNSAQDSPVKAVGIERRILAIFLGVLAFALCAIVLLLLDSYAPAAETIIARETFFSPTPSPSPSPVPSNEASFYGTWTAARVEVNKNKVKPYVEVGIGPGLIVTFQEDGTITGIVTPIEGPDIVQSFAYSAEGDSIYDDVGPEWIDGIQYYTRVRYFFKNPGELRCVYLLDGREVSDYILFTRLNDYQLSAPTGDAAPENDTTPAPFVATAAPTPPPATSIATARPVEY